MKKLIGVAAMALGLCGCASEGTRYHPAGWYTEHDVDIGKIATVSQWAEERGAKVMWINYPQKPKSAESETTSN